MKQNKILFIIILGIILTVFVIAESFTSSLKQEWYEGTSDDFYAATTTLKTGMTFNVTNRTFVVEGISLLIYRIGTPGTSIIGIYNTNATGQPTTLVTENSTFNANILTDGSNGNWTNITLPFTTLYNHTNYIILINYTTSGSINWRADDGGSYAYGEVINYNSANAWSKPGADSLFQVWGFGDEPRLTATLSYPNQSLIDYPLFIADYTSLNLVLSNATYYLWDAADNSLKNQTLVTIPLTNTTSKLLTGYGDNNNYIWNVYACGINATGVTCNWSSNMTFSLKRFRENSQTYNPNVISSNEENFKINITYDTTRFPSSIGNLVYNGISYSASIINYGQDAIFSRTINVPSSATETNYTFYWNIGLTNSSGTSYTNSISNNQTISPILMQLCNATINVTYFNFTVKDLDYPTIKVNATFKASFSYGTTNLNSNYSYQDLSEKNSSFAFCFFPSSSNLIVNAKIEYGATGYSNNYYYLNNASFSNQTPNISLYLLNSSKATPTVLKVQTETQSPLSETYIQIQRYDSGTDTYYTVAMAKTDFNGEDVVYLNWYDTFYKYTLSRNYETILMTNTSKISATPVRFTIPSRITYSYDKFLDIDYSLIFNNETNNFILTYSLPSGEITSACLRVVKRTIINDTTICNTCETSSSATIYCNIAAYGNGTYVATFYAIGSYGFIESIVELIGVSISLYEDIGNIDGSIYAFLFAGIIVVMFFILPVLGVVGMILGMLGAMILGFQPINYMEFLGITIIGGVVIILLKR